MDKLLYISTSGAKQNMQALAIHGNNLANVKTLGFKADLEQARSMQAFGEGLPTRVFAMAESPASDMKMGSLITTDRSLDVAVEGKGWIAVQDDDGTEAFTRSGSLKIDQTGLLLNSSNRPLLNDGGDPIFIPVPFEKIDIGRDGSISVLPQGAPPEAIANIGRIKLVNPPQEELNKGEDGLFRFKEGGEGIPDITVSLLSGALEGSNVNTVEAMTGMISLQRQFEMQVKMMRTAEEIDSAQNQLLRLS
jgi:flagellar basal-body rod protein FlgF